MTIHSFRCEIPEKTFPVEGRNNGKVVPVFNYAIRYRALRGMGEWRHSSTIIDLSTGWR
jgi:cellulose synthase/poly-beta-1,6-N-acetylglucosamine synthase-like glycosyltransferase